MRSIIPPNAPKIGEVIEVVDGPAHGKREPFTGTNLIYAVTERYVGDPDAPPDTDQIRRQHHYKLRLIEHRITDEELWVYWYSHSE